MIFVGIRTKMILLVGCTVVASATLSILGLYRFWNANRERMEDALVKRAEASALAYDQWIGAAKRQIHLLASLLSTDDRPASASATDLRRLSSELGYFDGIYIVSPRAEIVTHESTGEPPEPELLRRLLEASRESLEESALVLESDQIAEPRIYLAAGTKDGKAVVARIEAVRLGSVFKDIRLAGGSVVTVLDYKGHVFYRRSSLDDTFDPQLIRRGLADLIADKPNAVAELVSPHDGVKRVYGVARTDDGASMVAIGVASDEFFEPLVSGLFQRIVTALLIFVVSVGVAFVIAVSIVRPIRDLQRATNAFASGDRNARAGTKATSELGELAAAFNEMAEQINAREDKLQEADRIRSEYVSNVSHELKTPLTTIKTLTHVLDSGDLDQEQRRNYIKMIEAECDRQIGFVSDLLDAAALENSGPDKTVFDIDLIPTLKDAINSETLAATTSVSIILVPPAALPQVRTDPRSLIRIVRILIENALRYSPRGSTIEVSAHEAGDDVEVSVCDSGPGIHPLDLPHIFDKFYQGRNQVAAERENGENRVGLGLFIARGLASQIGVRIEARNAGRGGTVFSVFIPQARNSNNGSANTRS